MKHAKRTRKAAIALQGRQARTAPAEAARNATQTASTAAADAMIPEGRQKSLRVGERSHQKRASMLPTVSCMWLVSVVICTKVWRAFV